MVGVGKVFEALWWVSNRGDRNIFNDQVSKLIVGFGMLRTKVDMKINKLSSWNFTLCWFNSVMRIFILEGDLLRILLFVDTPMEGHKDWRSVSDSDGSSVFTRWICVFKINSLEGILLEVDFLAVNGYDFEVHHGSKTCELVKFRSLVITGQNEIFLQLTFLFRFKGDINVNGRAGIQVEL